MRRERKLDMIEKLAIQGGGRARYVVSRWRVGRVCMLGVGGETGRRSVRVSDGEKVKVSTMSGQNHQKNAVIDIETLGILCTAARASGREWWKRMRSHCGSKQCQEGMHQSLCRSSQGSHMASGEPPRPLEHSRFESPPSIALTPGDESHRLLDSVGNGAPYRLIDYARLTSSMFLPE